MSSLVANQRLAQIEAFPTLAALVRSLPRVDSLVPIEAGFVTKGLGTY